MRYCVIGAGAAGLAAARNLKANRIPFDLVERENDVGGIWDYTNPRMPVYRSTHLISSKRLTEFPDFPMPAHYPAYPSHRHVLEYLRSYARNFGLYEHIRFGKTVTGVEKLPQFWRVSFADGETRLYTGVILAHGFHHEPNLPEIPGKFAGEILHSQAYKDPSIFLGKRVLVLGAGNSGCDIAVDAAQNADRTWLSVRRGYHYLPKFIFGKPVDQLGETSIRWGLPIELRRWMNGVLLRVAVGRPQDYGLPKPDHKLFESHPIVNAQIFQYLGQGDIEPCGDVKAFEGKSVVFADGSRAEVDLIVFATGYRVASPFLAPKYLNLDAGFPVFPLHLFHPEDETLFILGMIQPDSGVWWLLDLQAKAVAGLIRAQMDRRAKALESFRKWRASPSGDLGRGIRYLRSPRHRFEVEHSTYAKRLRQVISKLQ